MSGERISLTNPELAERTRGLSESSIRIALNEHAFSRLRDFETCYVGQGSLRYFDGTENYIYGYSSFSGIGNQGTLINVRQRTLSNGLQPTMNRQMVVVAGSIEGTSEPLSLHDVVAHETSTYEGGKARSILLEPDAFLPFEDLDPDEPDDVKKERELQWWLEAERLRETTPTLRHAHGDWSYERPDGLIEPLHDFDRVYKEVSEARRRGFGQTALQPTTDEALQLSIISDDGAVETHKQATYAA